MALLSPASKLVAPCLELEFFQLASRLEISAGQSIRLTELSRNGLAWDRLLQAARKHGVAGLWHRHHAMEWFEESPVGFQIGLLVEAEAQTRQNLLGLALLKELHPVLSPEYVCLKGPLLAQTLYGNLSSRPSHDLDCWVPLAEVERMEGVLRELGWTPQIELYPEQEHWLREREYARTWYRTRDGAQLDLHWHWVPRGYSFHAEPELFSKRRRLARLGVVGGWTIPVLDAETHLNFLLWHGAKHNWERWMPLVDVAGWLRMYPGLDWDRVEAQAAAFGGPRILLWGLGLAAEMLDAPVPASFLERCFRNEDVTNLISAAARNLARLDQSKRERMDTLFIRALEQPADRQRHRGRILWEPTPIEWKMLRLPETWYGLYYVLRGVRMISSPIRNLLK